MAQWLPQILQNIFIYIFPMNICEQYYILTTLYALLQLIILVLTDQYPNTPKQSHISQLCFLRADLLKSIQNHKGILL
jgi:hypothetical protein